MRLRTLLAAMAGVSGLIVPISPASADPAVCSFFATAYVDPGLVITDPLRVAEFYFNGLPVVCTNGNNNVHGWGQLQGTCGHTTVGDSTPYGDGKLAGHAIQFAWVSAGTMIVVVGVNLPSHAVAVVNARADGPDPVNGWVPCVTAPATSFTVIGVAAIIHP